MAVVVEEAVVVTVEEAAAVEAEATALVGARLPEERVVLEVIAPE